MSEVGGDAASIATSLGAPCTVHRRIAETVFLGLDQGPDNDPSELLADGLIGPSNGT